MARSHSTTRRMDRSYVDAIAALNTLQSNFSTIEVIRKSGRSLNKQAIPEMIEWCRTIGYEPSDFNRLNPIHISGTKGKGSTCAFISYILCQYLHSPSNPSSCLNKIGLYTSPHLRFVRERIQINNQPLSEDDFAKYFFQLWDRMEDAAQAKGLPTDTSAKPTYFRFLTLMAFHTYMSEGVDTAIIECGIGGEYDSTNILVTPTVTGITSLGIDHVNILGNTIEEIAWHKGGIMKSNVPAFTVPQPAPAQEVLQQRAASKCVTLQVVPTDLSLSNIPLGLAGDFQLSNASLAVQIASAHLCALKKPVHPPPASLLSPEIIRGLKQARWPGRCEIRREKNIIWHIDCGHTLESIQAGAKWFGSHLCSSSFSLGTSSPSRETRILLFNQQIRDANALARVLHRNLADALPKDAQPFTHAIFCSNLTFRTVGLCPDLQSLKTASSALEELTVQKGLADTWHQLDAKAAVSVVRTIEEAVECVRDVAERMGGEAKVLATGSVHLVGGLLEVLEAGEGRREEGF